MRALTRAGSHDNDTEPRLMVDDNVLSYKDGSRRAVTVCRIPHSLQILERDMVQQYHPQYRLYRLKVESSRQQVLLDTRTVLYVLLGVPVGI